MAVGDEARKFGRRANDRGIELAANQRLPWLSGRGHTDSEVLGVDQSALTVLAAIHRDLGGDVDLLATKRRTQLPVDFLYGDSVIVEFDEFQHFSSPRMDTLQSYDPLDPHGIEVEEYRALCARLHPRADAYRAAKMSPDFPFPGGRTAQRAYLDATRDLLAPHFGYRVVRIPAPLCDDPDVSVDRLIKWIS